MTDCLLNQVLHSLRMKGGGGSETLADILDVSTEAVSEALATLCEQGIARHVDSPRGAVYSLTEQGASMHAEALAAAHSPECIAGLEQAYEEFLSLNKSVKTLFAAWQTLAPDSEEARWDAIDQLVAVEVRAQPTLQKAAGFAPRFQRYAARLASAVQKLEGGDERYFTGLFVDSFHNIWFECHEDFIQTLGRQRVLEGSF